MLACVPTAATNESAKMAANKAFFNISFFSSINRLVDSPNVTTCPLSRDQAIGNSQGHATLMVHVIYYCGISKLEAVRKRLKLRVISKALCCQNPDTVKLRSSGQDQGSEASRGGQYAKPCIFRYLSRTNLTEKTWIMWCTYAEIF